MQLLAQMTLLLLWLVTPSTETVAPSEAPPITMPNCQSVCGDVSIPYPFGIGPNSYCYLDKWYEIECNTSTIPPKPFLKHTKPSLEVLNISTDGKLHVHNPAIFFYGTQKKHRLAPNLTGSPFVYSQQCNRFVAVSCGYFALVKSDLEGVVAGCMSTCVPAASLGLGDCLGINCCQTTLPPYLTVLSTELQSVSEEAVETNHTKGGLRYFDDNHVFLVDQAWFQKQRLALIVGAVAELERVPVVLEWSFVVKRYYWPSRAPYSSYVETTSSSGGEDSHRQYNNQTQICREYSDSSPTDNRLKMKCFCWPGYDGNPYLPIAGCQDIDECKQANTCLTVDSYGKWFDNGKCHNIMGSYTCNSGTSSVLCNYLAGGSGVLCYPPTNRNQSYRIILGIGIGLGVLLLFIAAWCVYVHSHKKQKSH